MDIVRLTELMVRIERELKRTSPEATDLSFTYDVGGSWYLSYLIDGNKRVLCGNKGWMSLIGTLTDILIQLSSI